MKSDEPWVTEESDQSHPPTEWDHACADFGDIQLNITYDGIMKDKKKQYRFVLRLPRTLAEDLAAAAREEDVSLNQYMLYVLARYGVKKAK